MTGLRLASGALIALVAGCSDADAGSSAANAAGPPLAEPAVVQAKPAKIAPWDASQCGDDDYQNAQMERHPALMGLSPDMVASAYGQPSTSENFRVGEPVGTFYGAYGKRSGGPKSADEGKPMRVLTWTKKDCNFSIFFLQSGEGMKAVEAYEWAVGADF